MTICPYNVAPFYGAVSGPYDNPDYVADQTYLEMYGEYEPEEEEEESHCVWEEVWWRKEGLGAHADY